MIKRIRRWAWRKVYKKEMSSWATTLHPAVSYPILAEIEFSQRGLQGYRKYILEKTAKIHVEIIELLKKQTEK